MFGGGIPGGGYGNDAGNFGGDGGSFGGTGDQVGIGQGYGGSNFQAQPSIGGPGGFLSTQATQATPAAPGPSRQRREEQCLMPVTIKMLLKQRSLMQEQGQDAMMVIHGRQVSMLMFVACVQSCEQQISQQVYKVSDGTGEILVSKFNNQGEAITPVEKGKYVRIFGIMRSWQNDCKVTAHHIKEIEKAEEIALHEIEVSHTWLQMEGRLKKKVAAPQQQQQVRAATQQQGYQPPQHQGYQPPQQQGYQPPQATYRPPQQQPQQAPPQMAYQPPQQGHQQLGQQQQSYQPQQQNFNQFQAAPQAQQQAGPGMATGGGFGGAPAMSSSSNGQFGGNQYGHPQGGHLGQQFQQQAAVQPPQQASFNQQMQQLTGNSSSPYGNMNAPAVVH